MSKIIYLNRSGKIMSTAMTLNVSDSDTEYIEEVDSASTQTYNAVGTVEMLNELKSYTSDNIVSIFNSNEIYPFDVESLIKRMGITIIPYNFDNLEKKYGMNVKQQGSILGAVIATTDKIAMFYRQGESNNRKRFTLAHELAHCCLDLNLDETRGRISHIEYRKVLENNCGISPKEYNANIFAGEILIPEEPLDYVINHLLSPTIPNLSSFFGVSDNVMKERLRILGYNSYIKRSD